MTNPGPSVQSTVNVVDLDTANFIGAPALAVHQQAHALMGFNSFAEAAGVTGVNDGTRDDAILLRTAYASAVAAGASSLILPLGVVYLNSAITDVSYPYNYCVKNTVDDFSIVIPAGCTVFMTIAGSLGGNNTAAFLLAGAATVNRARVTGGGRIVHTLPLTANNNCSAVYIPAAGVDCTIDNLTAVGFGSTTVAAFDSSSSFKGTLTRLKTESCYMSVAQSSAQTTASHVISDIDILNAYFQGLTIDSGNNIVTNISVDQSGITPAAGYYGCALNGPVGNTTVCNMKLKGNAAVGGAGETGLKIRNGTAGNTGKVAVFGLVVSGYESGITPQGTRNSILIEGFEVSNFTYGIWKTPFNGVNCNEVTLKDGILDSSVGGSYGLLSGGTAADATQGLYNLNNVQMIGSIGTKFFNTSGNQIGSVINQPLSAMPPLAIQSKYQIVASAASVVATASIDGLTTILTGTTNTALTTPATPVDGQSWNFKLEGALTLTFTGTVAGGNPGAVAAGYSRTLIYDGTAATWV